jgi:hypothetical protein
VIEPEKAAANLGKQLVAAAAPGACRGHPPRATGRTPEGDTSRSSRIRLIGWAGGLLRKRRRRIILGDSKNRVLRPLSGANPHRP